MPYSLRSIYLLLCGCLALSSTVSAAETEPLFLVSARHLAGAWDGADWVDDEDAVSLLRSLPSADFYEAEEGRFKQGFVRLERDEIDGGYVLTDVQWVDAMPAWNPSPRARSEIGPGNAAYRKIATAVLRSVGDEPEGARELARELAHQQASVSGGYRADLNGDGVDEALVTGVYRDGELEPGGMPDYSYLLFRHLQDGAVRNVVLYLEVFPDRPDTPDMIPMKHLMSEFRVLDIADLNGDGSMEVVVGISGWESWAVAIWSYADGELVKVRESGWGH